MCRECLGFANVIIILYCTNKRRRVGVCVRRVLLGARARRKVYRTQLFVRTLFVKKFSWLNITVINIRNAHTLLWSRVERIMERALP